jgi:hypothetical protein
VAGSALGAMEVKLQRCVGCGNFGWPWYMICAWRHYREEEGSEDDGKATSSWAQRWPYHKYMQVKHNSLLGLSFLQNKIKQDRVAELDLGSYIERALTSPGIRTRRSLGFFRVRAGPKQDQ